MNIYQLANNSMRKLANEMIPQQDPNAQALNQQQMAGPEQVIQGSQPGMPDPNIAMMQQQMAVSPTEMLNELVAQMAELFNAFIQAWSQFIVSQGAAIPMAVSGGSVAPNPTSNVMPAATQVPIPNQPMIPQSSPVQQQVM